MEEECGAVNFRDVASRKTSGELSHRRVRNSAQTSSAQVNCKYIVIQRAEREQRIAKDIKINNT